MPCSSGNAQQSMPLRGLLPDVQVGFQVYIDDKGAGACDVTA